MLLLSANDVFAQKKKDGDTATYKTKEVVVAATRHAEGTMDIPASATVINREQLENIRGAGLDEALSCTPGVLAQSRAGSTDIRLTIRGFGARGAGDKSNTGTSRGIRVMTDGMPETEPDGRTSYDLVDPDLAQSIEVIRSNSSALWGNASGGVINISTMPIFSNPFITVREQSGSFGYNKFILQTGMNLGNSKMSIALCNSTFDGWRNHSAYEKTLFNIGLSAPLGLKTLLGLYLVGAVNKFDIPGPLTQAQYDADPQQSNPTYLSRLERRFNRLGRIGTTIEHSIDDDNIISGSAFASPKFLQRSERNTFRDFNRYYVGGNVIYRNSTAIGSMKNTMSVGIDAAYQDGAILFYKLANGQRDTALKTDKREGANTGGAFVQDELALNDKLSVTIGARYDKISYYTEIYFDDFGNKKMYENKYFSNVTPKLGLLYRLSDNQSLYANMGGGVEVPAGNETDPVPTFGDDLTHAINPLLDPITSTSFEIGTKHTSNNDGFFRSLSYNFAAYYISITNDIIPYDGGAFYFTAGKTTRTGLELGLNAQFESGLTLQTAITYSLGKYTDYKVDSVHYDKAKAGVFADYSQHKVAGVPDMFYNFSLKYAPSFSHGVFVEFGVRGVGDYFVNDANTTTAPASTIFNTTIGMSKPIAISNTFSAIAFITIQNLTVAKYVSSAFINPDLVTENGKKVPVFLEAGLPRTITLSFSLNWNFR